MTDDDKIVKLVMTKEKPPEETPGVTPDVLLKDSLGNYDELIIIGWHGDQFKISWTENLLPEDVNIQLDLAKSRLLNKLYEF